MAKFRITIDFLVMETFQRLFGVLSLCNLLDKTIPEAELEETTALREMAEGEGWDYGEYQAEVQGVEARFRHWLPRLSAYSIIILLHSILETQLLAYAERVGRTKKSAFRLEDIYGKGIEKARLFLLRVSAIDIRSDPSWKHLEDLHKLRNFIVHRGGKLAKSNDQKQAIEQLVSSYKGKLAFPEEGRLYGFGEIWVSMPLCRLFVEEVEGLDVDKVIQEFQKAEESSSGRNGTFKIDAPFEKALDTILKAKPEPKKPKTRR